MAIIERDQGVMEQNGKKNVHNKFSARFASSLSLPIRGTTIPVQFKPRVLLGENFLGKHRFYESFGITQVLLVVRQRDQHDFCDATFWSDRIT
jgi:hypothetical protein